MTDLGVQLKEWILQLRVIPLGFLSISQPYLGMGCDREEFIRIKKRDEVELGLHGLTLGLVREKNGSMKTGPLTPE